MRKLKAWTKRNSKEIYAVSLSAWMFTSMILAITLIHFMEYGFEPVDLPIKEDLAILFKGVFFAIAIWTITFIILFGVTKMNDKITQRSKKKEENK